MKQMKNFLALALAALMILSLTACSGLTDKATELQMTALVQGNIDELYLGKFDADYLKSVNSTEEEAKTFYEEGLAAEAEYFAYYFGIEFLTDDLKTRLMDLYREIYSHSSYTVGAASTLDETTVVVKVDVQPIDIFVQVLDSIEDHVADFHAKYTQDVVDAMDDAAYQAYDAEWADLVIDLVEQKLQTIGHEETTSLAVQVVLQDETWRISDDSMTNIDTAMITYP